MEQAHPSRPQQRVEGEENNKVGCFLNLFLLLFLFFLSVQVWYLWICKQEESGGGYKEAASYQTH